MRPPLNDLLDEPEPDVTRMTDDELAEYGRRLQAWELRLVDEHWMDSPKSDEYYHEFYEHRYNAFIREDRRRHPAEYE